MLKILLTSPNRWETGSVNKKSSTRPFVEPCSERIFRFFEFWVIFRGRMAGCGWGPHNEAGKENQSAATKSAKMPTVLGAFPPLPPAPGGGYWRVHPVRERRQHAGITRLDHTFDQKKNWSKTFFGKCFFDRKLFSMKKIVHKFFGHLFAMFFSTLVHDHSGSI